MPTEDELRDLFAGTRSPRAVDARTVIARSRRRRLPRRVAAGGIGALAVIGITVVGIQSFQPATAPSTMSQGVAAPSEAFESMKRAPADKLNPCEGTLARSAPSVYGLELDVTFPPEAAAGTEPVRGTVRLVNTGPATVVGTTTATPAVTLSRHGLVLWHSNGPMILPVVNVDLAPGESLDYPASFIPVRCAVADDAAESFPADLPAVPAGDYQLSAAIDFLPDASMGQLPTPGLDLVTGPTASITVR